MHHTNMGRYVVAGLKEVLQQEQVATENTMVIKAPVDNVSNEFQNTQQQLVIQLQQIQAIVQAIQMQYAAGTQNAHQYYGGRG